MPVVPSRPAAGAEQAAAGADALRVGVGRADITPPTGYFTMGNVRSDARAKGQHTRLQARAIVLARGKRKVVLVVTDLCCVAGGLLTEAATRLGGRGIDETNMVVAATHTHSAPGQYFPFAAHDITFPNVHTATAFSVQPDPQLYGFLARRIAKAIARADDDLGRGAAAWGRTEIPEGLTENRSIEAHLANYGIDRELGEGRAEESPRGVDSTIDPDLDVLRVDKRIGGRLVPVGMWSTFANHGTVNLGSRAENYNGDHLGAAMLASEEALRRAGGAPPGQDVVSAFSNADEGDTSSALDRTGPAAAEYVGRVEAAAMMRAWTDAGRRLSETPVLDLRWTRFCFCGQETEGGRVDDKAVPGLPLLSGSDEHRGQLHEHTGVVLEGERLPVEAGPQGNKIQLEPQGVPIPAGAPLALVRVGDGVIVSNPGEVTVEVGRRLKAAVLGPLAAAGVRSAAISGLANEYQGYFTTPEEYAWQAYEGGQTNFGKLSSVLLVEQTGLLAESMADGRAAPTPYPFDPTNGLHADHTPFPSGADAGTTVAQPDAVRRLQQAVFTWDGGPRGADRPLDRAFVAVQRRLPGGWRTVHDDLGTTIAWEVEGDEAVPLGARYAKEATTGTYRARWEVPLDTPPGDYRFVVTAHRYRLVSGVFPVDRGRLLSVRPVRAAKGSAAFVLTYPEARPYDDLTYRPGHASGGTAVVRVDGRTFAVRARPDGTFVVRAPAGATVVVAARSAQDRFGNVNRDRVRFTAGETTTPRPREPYPVLSRF
jgi:hypothetical protein